MSGEDRQGRREGFLGGGGRPQDHRERSLHEHTCAHRSPHTSFSILRTRNRSRIPPWLARALAGWRRRSWPSRPTRVARALAHANPRSDPDCIGTEMSIVWTGERCTWIHSAGNGEGCWRNLDECNADHASCPDMLMFRCGDQWCYKANQMCGAFADGRRRCVPSPAVPPSCDGLGSIAARCATERRGVEVTIARDLPCGHFGQRCAAGLERCEIVARRDWPPATTCVAKTAQSLEDCRVHPASRRLLGDDYLVRAQMEDLGTPSTAAGHTPAGATTKSACTRPADRRT